LMIGGKIIRKTISQMNNNLYLWGEIVGGNCPMKGEVPTLSHFLFWYVVLINGTMKKIHLKENYFALVDDDDYDYLMQWKWFLKLTKRNSVIYTYAICNLHKKDGWSSVSMHKMIMNTPKGFQIDHKDHNGLNNQRVNLRICTHGENQMNRNTYSKTGYMGVYENKWGNYYAQISHNKKIYRLGTFPTKEQAAQTYNTAAQKYHGEFAKLNIINTLLLTNYTNIG